MAKLVTTKVVVSRTYDIYRIHQGQTEKLDTITSEERPVKLELSKKYGVKTTEIVIEEVGRVTKTYGLPVDEFLKLATEISETEK